MSNTIILILVLATLFCAANILIWCILHKEIKSIRENLDYHQARSEADDMQIHDMEYNLKRCKYIIDYLLTVTTDKPCDWGKKCPNGIENEDSETCCKCSGDAWISAAIIYAQQKIKEENQ